MKITGTTLITGLIIIAGSFLCIQRDACGQDTYDRQRQEMVTRQIEARGVKDARVLEAMRSVPRERFVPAAFRHLAWRDGPLPIGEGQTISQPYIVALMTELLDLDGTEKVLEIGTGSGYQAAVLGELAKEVYSIEIIPELAERSEALLAELGYTNVRVRCGDGYAGWPEYAPFDAIIITCAVKEIPPPLVEQLAEGGRLVVPVGEYYQELRLLVKRGGGVTEERILPVRFVPMRRHRGFF